MRAAVITERNLAPVLQDFPLPLVREGATLIRVDTAGLGGWDVLGAYRLGVQFPCVIRGEGVGRTADGRRVYFGERSVAPFGAWAESTLVPNEEVWEVPDDVDDVLAITMGIAGTGALLPLEQAGIKPGESVLVLGATGTLGQIALQLARILGAGRVVGAARDAAALERLRARGLADAVVALGSDDDAKALRSVAGEGFDVVLDGAHARGTKGHPMGRTHLHHWHWSRSRNQARYRRSAVSNAQLCGHRSAFARRTGGHLAQAPEAGA